MINIIIIYLLIHPTVLSSPNKDNDSLTVVSGTFIDEWQCMK